MSRKCQPTFIFFLLSQDLISKNPPKMLKKLSFVVKLSDLQVRTRSEWGNYERGSTKVCGKWNNRRSTDTSRDVPEE